MRAAKGVLLERSDARVIAALATGSHTWVPTVRRSMRNEGPVHVTAAVDLLWRHAVPSLPPPILWMLGGGQGLLTRLGFFVSHLKRSTALSPLSLRAGGISRRAGAVPAARDPHLGLRPLARHRLSRSYAARRQWTLQLQGRHTPTVNISHSLDSHRSLAHGCSGCRGGTRGARVHLVRPTGSPRLSLPFARWRSRWLLGQEMAVLDFLSTTQLASSTPRPGPALGLAVR